MPKTLASSGGSSSRPTRPPACTIPISSRFTWSDRKAQSHFYAMQLIEGRTLAELIAEARRNGEPREGASRVQDSQQITPPTPLRKGGKEREVGNPRPSPRQAAELGVQAALGSPFRSRTGNHPPGRQAIEPADRDSGWLWVSDFGLARIAGQSDLTLSGAVLGTLRYMSPEQAFGPARRGRSSDRRLLAGGHALRADHARTGVR